MTGLDLLGTLFDFKTKEICLILPPWVWDKGSKLCRICQDGDDIYAIMLRY